MFKRADTESAADESLPEITFTFDGRAIHCRAGDSVAGALLLAGILSFRKTPVSAAPRGPYCMMGACFDCLVRIDNETLQACMTAAENGMTVESMPTQHDETYDKPD